MAERERGEQAADQVWRAGGGGGGGGAAGRGKVGRWTQVLPLSCRWPPMQLASTRTHQPARIWVTTQSNCNKMAENHTNPIDTLSIGP